MYSLREHSTGRTTDCRSRGFTLLELIIVLVLIGLLLVVSIPALRDRMFDDPLRSAGRKLIGYIDGVRDKAVREQQPYVLFIDLDENRLWHLRESDLNTGEAVVPEKGVLQLSAGVELTDVWMKATGTIAIGIPELWVSRQGYLDQAVFHLESGGEETLSLRVLPFIPTVEVLDGYYEPES